MGKAIGSRQKGSNSIGIFQRKMIYFKKQLLILFKSSRPYLAPRYWIIYFAAFGLGFYLWGPARGFTRLKNWEPFPADKSGQITAIETLQREIELLKKEINSQKLRGQESIAKFNPDSFSRPAFGEITQGFEWINVNNTWRLHTGIDIGTPQGGSIMASAEGVVKEIGEAPGEGLTVTLKHGDDWESIYANLEEVSVKKGDQIIKGTIIGTSRGKSCNSETPGFHFGIKHNEQPVNPGKIIKGLEKQIK